MSAQSADAAGPLTRRTPIRPPVWVRCRYCRRPTRYVICSHCIAAVRRAAAARDWGNRIRALNDAIEALGLSTLPRDAK